MCHKTRSENFNYRCINMTKKKNEDKHLIFKESKTIYNKCIPESEPF